MKHSVNIFFNENNYERVKDLIERRKISSFINDLIAKNSEKEETVAKEQIKKHLFKVIKK